MKFKYAVIISAVLFLGLVYYFVSYQTKVKPVENKQPQLSLQEMVNKTVTLEGKATNAKAGAILLVDNDPVYIEGLNSWSNNFIDKQISVFGKLVVKSFVPQAEVSNNGEISQGGSGDDNYVLENVDVGTYK